MDKQKQQLHQAQRRVPPDTSSTQTGHPNGGDWQEEVYQKIKQMKEHYLPELSEMNQKIAKKLMEHDSVPRNPKSELLEKLRLFKGMLERVITFLEAPKSSIRPGYKEKLVSYEKQIINFLNTNKPRKTIPGQQPRITQEVQPLENQPMNSRGGSKLRQTPIGVLYIPSSSSSSSISRLAQIQNSHLLQQQNLLQQRSAVLLPQAAPPSVPAADQNPISLPKLQNQTTLLPGTSLVPSATSLISVAQLGSVNGADWQDGVYRKIKLMKDLYIPELLELQVKITTSLQEYDTLPKNEESEPSEKLKLLNFMLEKAISFLEVSKPNISEKYKDNQELVLRERQIMNFVNMNRPGNLLSQLQQHPPMTRHDGWTAEHQAMQRVQTQPVPQSSSSSSLFSALEKL